MFFRGRVVSCCGLWLLFCRRMTPSGRGWRAFAPANAISVTLYYKLNFNFIRDTTPVAGISLGPLVMEVDPTVPPKTVPAFIAYAKDNPGKINLRRPATER